MQETPYHSEPSPQATSSDGTNSRQTLKPDSSTIKTDSSIEPTNLESLAQLHALIAAPTGDKQAAWDAKRREIDQITDGLGLGIDEGIKETVVAFNMVGLNTEASCEGHPVNEKHGPLTPWIDVAAPNQPAIQYKNEMETFEQVAHKYGISVEEGDHTGVLEACKTSLEPVQ